MSGRITADSLAKMPKISGDRVKLTVKWKDEKGVEKISPAESWVKSRTMKKTQPPVDTTMSEGPWIYNGSYLHEGAFIAEIHGIYIAIASMPDALINNPRLGAQDDKIWFANKEKLPPLGTPVELIIQLENGKVTQK
jgi:hypothetical protein